MFCLVYFSSLLLGLPFVGFDFFVWSLPLSLIKMVYAIAAKSGQRPRWNQIEHAVRRNFGGLVESKPVEIFRKRYFKGTDVSRTKKMQ